MWVHSSADFNCSEYRMCRRFKYASFFLRARFSFLSVVIENYAVIIYRVYTAHCSIEFNGIYLFFFIRRKFFFSFHQKIGQRKSAMKVKQCIVNMSTPRTTCVLVRLLCVERHIFDEITHFRVPSYNY